MSNEDQPESKPAQLSFEHALAELETIVAQLEEGQIPLAESLARYEQGVKLLRQCYQILENAERKIELLNRVDSDGQAHSEPFDDRDASLEEKAQAQLTPPLARVAVESTIVVRKRRRIGTALLE